MTSELIAVGWEALDGNHGRVVVKRALYTIDNEEAMHLLCEENQTQ